MFLKRCFDFIIVVPALIIISPLLVVLALCIILDSPGPALFHQVRVGQYGKLFRILKFRTMVIDAECRGPQLTVGTDNRITRVGRFLRRYKLDELPQLINVLRGEMSLVGPRPEVPRYVAHYSEDAKSAVLSVLPGITDLASIHFKDENLILSGANNFEEVYITKILPVKLSFYLEYVRNRSIYLDIKIILQTLYAVFIDKRESRGTGL